MKKGDHRKAALVGLRIVCHATLSAWSAAWDAVLLVWLLYGKPPMVSLGHVLLKLRSWLAYSKRQDWWGKQTSLKQAQLLLSQGEIRSKRNLNKWRLVPNIQMQRKGGRCGKAAL